MTTFSSFDQTPADKLAHDPKGPRLDQLEPQASLWPDIVDLLRQAGRLGPAF